jgi:hypothetical protein
MAAGHLLVYDSIDPLRKPVLFGVNLFRRHLTFPSDVSIFYCWTGESRGAPGLNISVWLSILLLKIFQKFKYRALAAFFFLSPAMTGYKTFF